MEIIWKHVPEKYGNYEVSNLGELRNNKSKKIKKTRIHKTGYVYGKTAKNGKRINVKMHRLVAETFLPNEENKKCVNHINGNKTDNRLDNLEWCTHKENMQHAISTGLFDPYKQDKRSSYTRVYQYTTEGKLVREWDSIIEAATTLGISRSNISSTCQGKQKTSGGFYWEYINEAKKQKTRNKQKKEVKKISLAGLNSSEV